MNGVHSWLGFRCITAIGVILAVCIFNFVPYAYAGMESSKSVALQVSTKNTVHNVKLKTEQSLMNSQFTQKYHLYTPTGFMNDIQTIWKDSKHWYHFMYLQNPDYKSDGDGPVWMHMKTKDFIHYKKIGVSIPKFNGVWQAMASGSIISNSSGFFKDLDARDLIAYFTSYVDGVQQQFVAYSKDQGKTFMPYVDRAIMSASNSSQNFRDPFMTFDEHNNVLLMYLAEGNKIGTYRSNDGVHFDYVGATILDAQQLDGADLGLIECPNIKTLTDPHTKETKTILFFGANGYRHNQPTGTYYMIGHLDTDKVFIPEQQPKRIDDGSDYYGANFVQINDNEIISLGWMGNWDYSAQDISDDNGPTYNLGSLSLPHRLSLSEAEGNYTVSNTLLEPKALFGKTKKNRGTAQSGKKITQDDGYTIIAHWKESSYQSSILNFTNAAKQQPLDGHIRVTLNQHDSHVAIEYDAVTGQYVVNRSTTHFDEQKGSNAFSKTYSPVESGVITPKKLSLHIFEDQSSVEFFIAGSNRTYSLVKYSTEDTTETTIEATGDTAVSYTYQEIENPNQENSSIWKRLREIIVSPVYVDITIAVIFVAGLGVALLHILRKGKR